MMKNRRFWLCLPLFLLAPLASQAQERAGPQDWVWQAKLNQDDPRVGRVWRLASADSPDKPGLTDELRAADFILLGERHDHPDQHRLQAWLVSRLVELGRRPTLAWEMLPQDRTPALDRYTGTAAGFGDFVNWTQVWGDNWALYQPIAEAALAADAPQVGADLTRQQKKAVGQTGFAALGRAEAQRLGLTQPFLDGAEARLRDSIAQAHCGLLPETALPAMAKVQRARDAAMADALLAARTRDGGPVVLIAGNGHVAPDYAVGWYLRQRAPELKVLALSFREARAANAANVSADDGASAAGRFLPAFDWYTPQWKDEDPCVAFAASLKKLKNSTAR
tara:strand:- start:4651 stop:5658 length:1008 start_codon:yes stop_codon:yes gene_type:complete